MGAWGRNFSFANITLSAIWLIGAVLMYGTSLWQERRAESQSIIDQQQLTALLERRFDNYMTTLLETTPGSFEEFRLQHDIIELSHRLGNKTIESAEAQEFSIRGKIALELASDIAGIQKALDEFRKATRVAPWMPAAHYNVALLEQKISHHQKAVNAYNLYLDADPYAADAEKVKSQIYALNVAMLDLQTNGEASYGMPLDVVMFNAAPVPVHAEPDTESDILENIPARRAIRVLSRSDEEGWSQVQLAEDQLGYIESDLLSQSLEDLPLTVRGPKVVYRTIEVERGEVYSGEVVEGRWEGYGVYTWADGLTYEGEWLNNQMHGYGVQTAIDGHRFAGEWQFGGWSSYGTINYPSGHRYEGKFQNSNRSLGTMFFPSGAVYEGEWGADGREGYGVQTNVNRWFSPYLWKDDKQTTKASAQAYDAAYAAAATKVKARAAEKLALRAQQRAQEALQKAGGAAQHQKIIQERRAYMARLEQAAKGRKTGTLSKQYFEEALRQVRPRNPRNNSR